MRLIIRLTFLFICSFSFAQTNLLDISTWTVGMGSVPGFNVASADEENIREMSVGPHGTSVLLWKTNPQTVGGVGAGGWNTTNINIDPTKTYRFSAWLKKTNSKDGVTHFRARPVDSSGNIVANNLDGTPNTNPYFWQDDVPTLDVWYLLVGYIHNSTSANTISIGGVYDTTGNKIVSITDFKFQATASQLYQSVWLTSNTNANDRQYYYYPTIYEVNGQEPTIQQLISGSDSQAPSTVILSSTSQTDTTVDLSWKAAIDGNPVVVTGHKIYKDGILEATLGNVFSYQVTGLTAATDYIFYATALDAAGNESSTSRYLSVTTNSATIWTLNNQNVYYNTGNVGIGTITPDEKLSVNGNIHTKEVRVDLKGWSDFVFEKDYQLPTLEDVEKHIKEKGHLKNIPSAEYVKKNGILLGDMNAKLLQKIEELTLYILQQQKELDFQNKENTKLQNRLVKLEKLVENIKE